NDKIEVCKVMFLNTLGIPERQVRTVLSKTTTTGCLQDEQRGGRREKWAVDDELKRQSVLKSHQSISRMESHYCKANTSQQYLSSELTITKMFDLYAFEPDNISVSYSFYHTIFKSQNLKFHVPKKDMFAICDRYRTGSEQAQYDIKQVYEKISQRNKKFEIKKELKNQSENNPQSYIACYDLQQVISLPISKRGELFYKRKLSCYNFTVYNVTKEKGTCYLWHEAQAKRGANEIVSYVFVSFLMVMSSRRISYQRMFTFSDGCGGQNKNSIVPTMIHYFIHEVAQSIEQVTLYYFETGHGQSEGDTIHSNIERALKKAGNVYVPSQLPLVLTLACKTNMM
ncbi:uncharacterized protein LOC141912244, partial [Tubulanus polymorphus]|uniref:uncharacterized protein LOC141912244 n=1 Tax=Tubulanus polymorphus TaxID=672921 RepID=UPI003DA40F71